MKQERTLLERDPSAHLYERQAPALLTYFYRHIASWDDAEDLLTEVFLAALESQRFWEMDESEQQYWLWKVARNKTADYFRRLKRRPSLPLDLEVIEAVVEDDALTPEQKLLKQEEYADLHVVLKTLPQTQREILELRFGHDLTCGQIAAVLAKTESAVRMLLFRALRHLRGIYKGS